MIFTTLKPFVKNLPNFIISKIDDIIAPLIKIILEQATYLLLSEFAKKSKQDARLTAVELYPIVDTKLEKLAAKTETKLDDAIVEGIMSGIEAFAKDQELELPNLDED